MQARNSLITARRFMTDLQAAYALAVLGDDEGARRLLGQLAERAERELPVIAGVIEGLERAARELDAAHRPQSTQRTFTDRFGRDCVAGPNLHASNDDQPITSEQPGPSVA